MGRLSQSYNCGASSDPIIYETIGNYLDHIAGEYPDAEALVVCHQDIRWTYAEFNQKVDELAAGLLNLGIVSGERVGIWGLNSYEWVLTQMATAKIGAILVCINPAYRLYELEHALNKSGCRAIVSAEQFKSSKYLDMLYELAPELNSCEPGLLHSAKLPQLEIVIRMGSAASPGMLNFPDVCTAGGEKERQRLEELRSELRPDDPINIQFTSGTTGSPKGATLTHCNILNNGYLTGAGMQLTDEACHLGHAHEAHSYRLRSDRGQPHQSPDLARRPDRKTCRDGRSGSTLGRDQARRYGGAGCSGRREGRGLHAGLFCHARLLE